MKKYLLNILLVSTLSCFSFWTIAQVEQSRSISQVDYMKVNPDQVTEYLEVEKVWRKIHKKNIAEGKYQYWTVQEIISPYGSHYEYNYVTRISFRDPAQYSKFVEVGMVPANIQSVLSRDEMKLFERTESTRSLVKSEIWQQMDMMDDGDDSDQEWKYSKFNFFVINEGFTPDDFVEVQSLWSPVHKARIDDDRLEGWVVLRKLMPYGSLFDERYATVDQYKSMEALLLDDPSRYFDMLGNAEEANRKTEEGANLARQEIRRMVMDSR